MKTTSHTGRLFGLFLMLFVGVLIWFFTAAEGYYNFASASIKTAAGVPPLPKDAALVQARPEVGPFDTEIKYRKFFITAPQAQTVELVADFNRWGKDPLVLTPYKKGYFETSVALATGEYKYGFLVDGTWTADPSNQDRQTLPDGREICIKTVR